MRTVQIGERYAGEGMEAAHVNTVLDERSGPVGVAWASALATPTRGHAPFLAVIRPGLPVQPPTLFVNKATIAGERHAEMTWGAAQAAVAAGVADCIADDTIKAEWLGELVLIAAVWVNPNAADAKAVFENNRRATRRALRQWMTTAHPIELEGLNVPAFAVDSAFPVVAVVGMIRPQVIIARSVLAACPADELRAILSHEQQHLARRDNLRRAVLTWLPDVLSFLPAGSALIAMWHDATEAVADDAASELGPTGRVSLAAALLRVARLAPAGSPVISLPASALYRGEDIAERVHRLLAPQSPAIDTSLSGWRRTAMSAGLIVGGGMALHAMHEIVEAAVSFLP